MSSSSTLTDTELTQKLKSIIEDFCDENYDEIVSNFDSIVIGLDLVAVKPTPGPKIDLLFIDFRYDDTTALDTVSERVVQKSIDQVCKGKTSIIIAHRLSTVKNCDKIFVLKSGVLLASGSHDWLILNCHYYKELVKHQLTNKVESNDLLTD